MRKPATKKPDATKHAPIAEVLPPSPASEPEAEPTPEQVEAPEEKSPAPSTSPVGLIPELGISPVALATATFACDEPEEACGGACHVYRSLVYNADGDIAANNEVTFHKGALSTVGGVPNGIADSTLLSILAHRWQLFQSGPFASEQTGKALEHVLAAVDCLNERTQERTKRGVQGEYKK